MTQAVLFDLDDTVFDHKHSRLGGLAALQKAYTELRAVPLPRLEEEHEALLQADYGRVLDGSMSLDEGRVLRMRGLFQGRGVMLDEEEAGKASIIYRTAYENTVRPVPGVVELLERLSQAAVLGMITNGLEEQQMSKLRSCKVERFFTAVLVSESVGVRKPDHAIFRVALDALDAAPERTAMVGDSWSADIVPAHELGMTAVWLNRYGKECPDTAMATEIADYEDIDLRPFLQPRRL